MRADGREGCWSRAYARQAEAERRVRDALLGVPEAPECVRLHLLQMACEKLCKAHQALAGTPVEALVASHRWVEKTLPLIVRSQWGVLGLQTPEAKRHCERSLRSLRRQIDLLAPRKVTVDGRSDNSEYPWDDGTGRILAPVDYAFPNLHLLTERAGTLLLKLVPAALSDLLAPDASDSPTGF